jgi:hypothetical protein
MPHMSVSSNIDRRLNWSQRRDGARRERVAAMQIILRVAHGRDNLGRQRHAEHTYYPAKIANL